MPPARARAVGLHQVGLYLGIIVGGFSGYLADDPKHAVFGPQEKTAMGAFATLSHDGAFTPNTDYNAATSAFLNGDAGLYINGTWLIDSFTEAAAKPGSPLSGGYYVTAFPTLMGKPAV